MTHGCSKKQLMNEGGRHDAAAQVLQDQQQSFKFDIEGERAVTYMPLHMFVLKKQLFTIPG